MKQKFLALVEEVKNTGIVDVLYETCDEEELTAEWQKFFAENQELITKIKDWASEFKASGAEAIFEDGETIKNPMEIAVCIKIIDNIDVSECEVFSDWHDLMYEIECIENDFAVAVAKSMENDLILDITAEDIFFNLDEDDSEDYED